MTRISPVLVTLAAGALAIVEAGAAQQFDVSAPSSEPVPGFASIDVGGRSLRYKCFGAGVPTVLIEPGGGVSLETVFSLDRPIGWAMIVPQISKLTRVCVYDRCGQARREGSA